MAIVIETGIPIPERNQRNSITAALKKMEIGDSFVIEKSRQTSVGPLARQLGIKIATKVDEKQSDKIRVWRVMPTDTDINNMLIIEFQKKTKTSVRQLAELLGIGATSAHRWVSNTDKCPDYVNAKIRSIDTQKDEFEDFK